MAYEFPQEFESLLVRTDFSDDQVWQSVYADACAARIINDLECQAEFDVVIDDAQLDQKTADELLALVTEVETDFFVADTRTMTDPEHPILVIYRGYVWTDGDDEPDDETEVEVDTFRVIPSAIWGPEINLRIGNMDFQDFSSNTDDDGVYRKGGHGQVVQPPTGAREALAFESAQVATTAPTVDPADLSVPATPVVSAAIPRGAAAQGQPPLPDKSP